MERSESVSERLAREYAELPTVRDRVRDNLTFDVVSWDEFRDQVAAEVPFLVPGVIPKRGIGFIGAAPKRGKTMLAADLSVGLATGTSFLGQPVAAARVLYLGLEGQDAGLRARVGFFTRGRGLDPDDDPFVGRLAITTQRMAPGINLTKPEWGDRLASEAAAHEADLVVIDVLRRAAPSLPETGEGAVVFNRIIEHLAGLLADDRTILFLHHFVKGSLAQDRFTGELLTGSGALFGAMDFGIFIKPSEMGQWEREMPLEFEARDFEPPRPMIVRMEGEGGGQNGSLRYVDAATILPAGTTHKVDKTRRAIIDFLASYTDHEGWASQTAIVKGLGVRKDDGLPGVLRSMV